MAVRHTTASKEFDKDGEPRQWVVYIVQCSDETLYTGISTNLSQRVANHNTPNKGAKYTRTRRPVVLVYAEDGFLTMGQASAREREIKEFTRFEKLQLIASQWRHNLLYTTERELDGDVVQVYDGNGIKPTP